MEPTKHTTTEPPGSLGFAVIAKLNAAEENFATIVGTNPTAEQVTATCIAVLAHCAMGTLLALRDIAYAIRESK
jgi:hypothetical protein